MEEVDSIQEQMGNAHKEMEILRNIKRKWQKSKSVPEIKAFDGLMSRLDIAKGTIIVLKEESVETS